MTVNETLIVSNIKDLCPIIEQYYKTEAANQKIIRLYVRNSDYEELTEAKTILDLLHAIQTLAPVSFSMGALSENKGDQLAQAIAHWRTQVYGSLGTTRARR